VISVKGDVSEITRWLTTIERKQIPFATRLALRDTADHIARDVMPRKMESIFDRPTRWTKNAFYSYQPRGKENLVAYVNIKDGGSRFPTRGGKIGTPAFNYLRVFIPGSKSAGRRANAKSHEKKLRRLGILGTDEYTVPGKDMRLDRFGNITGRTYSKILADVQGADVGIAQGFGQATTKKGKKRFFYHPNLRPRGIYERTCRKKIRVALLFVKSPRYTPRFDKDAIAAKEARRFFPGRMRLRLQQALRTAR